MFSIRLFGPIEIEVEDRRIGPRDFGGIKPKQVLQILLSERGRAVSKARIADLLWPEDLPENASATLETYVSLLRRRLKVGGRCTCINTEPGAYRFVGNGVEVDLDQFDLYVRERQLDRALALVRGEVMEDEPDAPWALGLREIYRARCVQALVDAAQLALDRRDHPSAVAYAEQAIERDAACERAYRVAMIGQYALGRAEIALRTHQRCERALREWLGTDPLSETNELRDAILAGRSLDAPLRSARVVRTKRSAGAEVPLLGRTSELERLSEAAESTMNG